MVATSKRRRNGRKSDPFPMEEFKNLLRRYCREQFSTKEFEDDAGGPSPYIGVCIGDDYGSKNLVIIGAPTIEDILDGKGDDHA